MEAEISISIQEADFDVGRAIDDLSHNLVTIGAVASFVGLVRHDDPRSGENPGVPMSEQSRGVQAMTLEHYPGMTEAALTAIVAEASNRWALPRVRIIHRIGRLLPGERIVFVGVAGAHRGEAFAACEFIMDYLKTRAPFWKKEETTDGGRWVDARETDDVAVARWQ